ncbi:MAG: hypothetical protein PHF11_02205 [Candidatus Omnitrophica bacterium]|nr:hypothetical protein [Candidatus Omnitrophota bacterium]
MKLSGRLALMFFVKQKRINTAGLKTILVNRADRLGDAIISLPLLLELGKRFDITVLTSQYNDSILKEFFKTRVIVDKPPSTPEFIRKIFSSLVSYGYLRRDKNAVPRYDIYLDLIGIRGLGTFLEIRKENLCRYYIGFNISVWSLLLDYSYRSSVELSGANVVDAAQKLIKDSMGIGLNIPDYVDLGTKMILPSGFEVRPPYILVNVAGFDKFRGPSAQMYARLINNLEFAGTFVIMDELDQPNLGEFKRHIERKNVVYLEKNYSIWELLYISKNAVLYIGSNSGITNILQVPTHCVIFLATTSATVWNPFSKNPYQRKKIGRLIAEETTTSVGLMKKIIYRPVWCRPCYDFGCKGARCIKGLEKESRNIAQEINKMIRYAR